MADRSARTVGTATSAPVPSPCRTRRSSSSSTRRAPEVLVMGSRRSPRIAHPAPYASRACARSVGRGLIELAPPEDDHPDGKRAEQKSEREQENVAIDDAPRDSHKSQQQA